jgi:hypothetical protein
MTRFDALQSELVGLRMRLTAATAIPAALIAVVVVVEMTGAKVTPTSISLGLVTLFTVPLVLHRMWRALFGRYRRWSDREIQIKAEIAELRRRISAIFDKYRERGKGEQFKAAYDLTGKTIQELEESLAVGMFRERHEVFVTAFVRAGIAVRVTASIGSPYRCAAADNPARWVQHIERLQCEEIRQYHNHPEHKGKTRPSPMDFRTSRLLKSLLGPHGAKLRSLIICWNGIREWKVFEYDHEQKYWLCFEFDVSNNWLQRTRGHQAVRG